MDINVSKIGERGQIVIPQEFRKDLKLKKGEKMIIVRDDSKLVLEAIKNLSAKTLGELGEDIEDMKTSARFWDDLKKGRPVIMQSGEDFLRDLEKW